MRSDVTRGRSRILNTSGERRAAATHGMRNAMHLQTPAANRITPAEIVHRITPFLGAFARFSGRGRGRARGSERERGEEGVCVVFVWAFELIWRGEKSAVY